MKKKILIASILSIALLLFSAESVFALDLGFGSGGLLGNAAKSGGYDVANTNETTFAQGIGRAVQLLLSFLGIIFTLLMLYAGFIWMTARGNEEAANKSKSTIQMALIGLIIVLGAYAITAFVMNYFFTSSAGSSTSAPNTNDPFEFDDLDTLIP